MTHQNEYPGKTFVPYEGDMPVEAVQSSADFRSDREGIQGVYLEQEEPKPGALLFSETAMICMDPAVKQYLRQNSPQAGTKE